jgi:predicted cupin superfamily sugar epimerase
MLSNNMDTSAQTSPLPAWPAEVWVQELGMTAHPEGGFYKEVYRSKDTLSTGQLPERYPSARALGTSIFYLLRQGERSVFHRLISDELWYYHSGGPLEIIEITPEGQLIATRLGPNILAGEVLQHCVPKGHWFGARPLKNTEYSLLGCVVFPGFEFEDFELAEQQTLVSQYPQHRTVIEQLTPKN